MNATAIMAAISMAARYAALALQIEQDAAPFIALIEKWATGAAAPTVADFDAMHAMAQPLFAKLNDTSRDVP